MERALTVGLYTKATFTSVTTCVDGDNLEFVVKKHSDQVLTVIVKPWLSCYFGNVNNFEGHPKVQNILTMHSGP